MPAVVSFLARQPDIRVILAVRGERSSVLEFTAAARKAGAQLTSDGDPLWEAFAPRGTPFGFLLQSGVVKAQGIPNTLQHLEDLLHRRELTGALVPAPN
jgi:hypothetical protein